MRITRLHLLIAFIGLACAGYGFYTWKQRALDVSVPPLPSLLRSTAPSKAAPAVSPKTVSSSPATSDESLKASSARQLAEVGAAYERLRSQVGDIPDIAGPLRTAKRHQAQGRHELVAVFAKQAWRALKDFKEGHTSDTYQVLRGDTLWGIAKLHSPVKQGPAWVGVWRANKKIIKDFDHLPAGLVLAIPQDPNLYVTRYWTPRMLRMKSAQERQIVNTAELPVLRNDGTVDIAELPAVMESVPEGFIVSAIQPPSSLYLAFSGQD